MWFPLCSARSVPRRKSNLCIFDVNEILYHLENGRIQPDLGDFLFWNWTNPSLWNRVTYYKSVLDFKEAHAEEFL